MDRISGSRFWTEGKFWKCVSLCVAFILKRSHDEILGRRLGDGCMEAREQEVAESHTTQKHQQRRVESGAGG